MPPTSPSTRQLRLLGFLPLAFFFAQATHYWQTNEFGHVLWMCNIGNLLLACGLFLRQALLIRVAVIWMVPGLAVWAVYVVPTWGALVAGDARLSQYHGVVSSTLAHVGGLSVGLAVLQKVRMDGQAWFYAFLWYLIVSVFSRLLTPAALNVNRSHKMEEGWEQTFSSYWKFWLVLTLLTGIILWLIGFLLRMIWPTASEPEAESTQATT